MITDRIARGVTALLLLVAWARLAGAEKLLIPMDDDQQNHLKAYGLTYNAIKNNQKAEWLLNYRGGAFLLPDLPELRRDAAIAGVSFEQITNAKLDQIRSEMATANMDAVPLEKAPKVAVYTP